MSAVSPEPQKHWHLKLRVRVSIRHGSVHFRVEDLRRRVEREAAQWRPWGLCCLHIRAPEEARPDRSLYWLFRWGPDLLLSSHSHISRLPGLSLLNLEFLFLIVWSYAFNFFSFVFYFMVLIRQGNLKSGIFLWFVWLLIDGFWWVYQIWFDRAYGIVLELFLLICDFWKLQSIIARNWMKLFFYMENKL